MQKQKGRKVGLIVGRFQPFHKGHMEYVLFALSKVDFLIIAIGSSQFSMTIENPYTAEERREMISEALDAEGIAPERYAITLIPDENDHSKWMARTKALEPTFDVVFTSEPVTKGLFEKEGYEVLGIGRHQGISATSIRNHMLRGGDWEEMVPPAVAQMIERIDGVQRIIDMENND